VEKLGESWGMDEPIKTLKTDAARTELAALSIEDFKERVRNICGPAPRKVKPTVRTPEDRGYNPEGGAK
jgi:hypothetical protein